MTSEKKIEIYNRAIGYRECVLDIIDSDLVHGKAIDKLMAMLDARYGFKALTLLDATYGLKADEVLEND